MLFWNLKFLASPWKYHLPENLQIRFTDPDKRPGMGDRIRCSPDHNIQDGVSSDSTDRGT